MSFNPAKKMVGGFAQNDGTIDFYLRINSLLDMSSVVLDLGAGRASWYEDDNCNIKKEIRLLKGKVKKLIAADIDDVVLQNRASDEQIVIENDVINIKPNSIDLIISDFTLEHIENPKNFFTQVNKCLKRGGWFCARTPHKYNYITIFSSLIKNSAHPKLLKYLQPDRKESDIFPTQYKMNRLKDINFYFTNWENLSFIYKCEPSYYFGSKIIYFFLSFLHRLMPSFMCGNLFIFIKKP